MAKFGFQLDFGQSDRYVILSVFSVNGHFRYLSWNWWLAWVLRFENEVCYWSEIFWPVLFSPTRCDLEFLPPVVTTICAMSQEYAKHLPHLLCPLLAIGKITSSWNVLMKCATVIHEPVLGSSIYENLSRLLLTVLSFSLSPFSVRNETIFHNS